MNYSRFLNPVSLARKPSAIRVLTGILAKSPPSMISLAGGLPNPDLFPFESADITLKNGEKIHLDQKQMNSGLQYGPTPGQPQLLDWLRTLQCHIHKPPTVDRPAEQGGMDMCITVGSQDGLCKTFEMLIQPGDNIVTENPTYSGTLSILKPLGCNILGVDTDEHGMKPDMLRQIMSKWKHSDVKDPKSDVPKVIYSIPNGGNPTGISLTLARKKEIYQIAREYDMIIMEDDPYYFLQFEKPEPSFLELDEDGRVLRYDSFSKIISSGLRTGLVTGPQPLINKISLHMQVSVLHTPAMSQMLLYEVLSRWGIDGFMEHVQKVVQFYKGQRDLLFEAASTHLTGLAEWNKPTGGMFLWIKLLGIADSKKLIEEKALKKEVLLVPGCVFMTDSEAPSPHVRASYSLASKQQMDQGMERLALLLKEELALQEKN